MRDVVDLLLQARRKSWLRSRPVFEPYASASSAELARVQHYLGSSSPPDLIEFLAAAGYGDIGEELAFRAEWFKPVESGQLKGAVQFAQDILGNFYAVVPGSGRIIFFSRSEPAYAVLAASFRAFMEELARREYKIIEWVDSLSLQPYEWQSA